MKNKYDPFKDSCRDCKNFNHEKTKCGLKGHVFDSEEAMHVTASKCWAFDNSGWKSMDPDLFITQQTKSEKV